VVHNNRLTVLIVFVMLALRLRVLLALLLLVVMVIFLAGHALHDLDLSKTGQAATLRV